LSFQVLLNPAKFVIPPRADYSLSVFVLAKNKAEADELAFPKSSEEQFFASALVNNRHLNVQTSANAQENPSSPKSAPSSTGGAGGANSSGRTTAASPEKASPAADSSKSEGGNGALGADSSKKSSKRNLWKLLKRSSLLQKKIEMDSFQEKLQKLEEKHMVPRPHCMITCGLFCSLMLS
jgi:hypothetical protein